MDSFQRAFPSRRQSSLCVCVITFLTAPAFEAAFAVVI